MKTIRVLLVVSLLLNLFLAGALIGGAAWLHGRQPMIQAGSLRIAGAELAPAQRRAFRATLHETRRSMRPVIQQSRAAKREAADLLRQPVVDQAAVLAALARARSADTAVRAAVEQSAVAFTATLPPADRARVADAMVDRADNGRRAAQRR